MHLIEKICGQGFEFFELKVVLRFLLTVLFLLTSQTF